MTLATTLNEIPVFFPSAKGALLGIVTEPTGSSRGMAVVVLSGGGTPLSSNVNRVSVRLCRRISELGFHAFRFDYHGVGESGGITDRFDLANPFLVDVDGALAFLRSREIDRFVLVGSCFGARTALAAAAVTSDVVGIALISPPVRDFQMGERTATRLARDLSLKQYARSALQLRNLRRLKNRADRLRFARYAREKWLAWRGNDRHTHVEARYQVSPLFMEHLAGVVERGLSPLMIFGEDEDLWKDFRQATSSMSSALLSEVAVSIVPGTVHGFPNLESQCRVVELIDEWIDSGKWGSGQEALGTVR
jgi:pimeloyl-ACP methyl ester carboxylesterase